MSFSFESIDVAVCRIPGNHIDPRRYPLLMARSIMYGVIDELEAGRRSVSTFFQRIGAFFM